MGEILATDDGFQKKCKRANVVQAYDNVNETWKVKSMKWKQKNENKSKKMNNNINQCKYTV